MSKIKSYSNTTSMPNAAEMFSSMRHLSEYIRVCPDYMRSSVNKAIRRLMIPAA